MDALVTYSSSESDDECCQDHLSRGIEVAVGNASADDDDDVTRKENSLALSQHVSQTDSLQPQPREEGDVLSAGNDAPEQTKDIKEESALTSATVQSDVSVAGSTIRYAKENYFKLAERDDHSVDESSATLLVEDYFGFCVTEADDMPDAQYTYDLRQQSKSTAQNVSAVNFWSTDVTADDWAHPEKIWGAISNSTESKSGHANSKIVNSVSDNTVSEIKRYSSKRHKPDISSESTSSADSSVPMKKSCFTVHHKLAPHLHTSVESNNCCPKKILRVLPGHSGTVNRIHWSVPEYSHLLLTASMDSTIRVWNVFSARDSDPCVRTLRVHSKAVKAARWSACGRQILSCSYDKFAKLTDVECGSELGSFQHQDHVSCVKFNPVDHNVFISGLTNLMLCWDKRCPPKPVRRYVYKDKFGQVQDLCFFDSGSQFLSCNDIVGRDSPDRTIMIWDFTAGALLSNQIYQEMYTCTRLCFHTKEPKFFAQSNGDYIAEFSAFPPYRINKCKRFEGHKVAGYSVGCDVSPDGKYIISGSSDGRLVVYDYRVARMLHSLPVSGSDVVLDVAWHPVLFSTVAAGTWNGQVVVWQ